MVVRYNIDQIVFAIPSVKNSEKQEILSICAKTGCQLKTVPALYEIMEQGEHASYPIRDIDILDLLGRDEVQLNVEEISGYLEGKTVLVTGGGGSIGSELCRQIALFHPKKLIIFDIYENNAYDVQNELLIAPQGFEFGSAHWFCPGQGPCEPHFPGVPPGCGVPRSGP